MFLKEIVILDPATIPMDAMDMAVVFMGNASSLNMTLNIYRVSTKRRFFSVLRTMLWFPMVNSASESR